MRQCRGAGIRNRSQLRLRWEREERGKLLKVAWIKRTTEGSEIWRDRGTKERRKKNRDGEDNEEVSRDTTSKEAKAKRETRRRGKDINEGGYN